MNSLLASGAGLSFISDHRLLTVQGTILLFKTLLCPLSGLNLSHGNFSSRHRSKSRISCELWVHCSAYTHLCIGSCDKKTRRPRLGCIRFHAKATLIPARQRRKRSHQILDSAALVEGHCFSSVRSLRASSHKSVAGTHSNRTNRKRFHLQINTAVHRAQLRSLSLEVSAPTGSRRRRKRTAHSAGTFRNVPLPTE
jgi:hypothetical protein